MFAAIPQPRAVWGDPAPATLAALRELAVEPVPVRAPFGREGAYANKIAALRVPAGADRLVLLDTDILALGAFRDDPRFDLDIAAKPADFQTWSDDIEIWRRTFAAAGATLPDERVVTTVSGERTPPYFNSGVLVVADPLGLANEWEECARALLGKGLPFADPWEDQPSLAVALRRLESRVGLLDERLNFPAHVRALDAKQDVVFCHYHSPTVVRGQPVLLGQVRRYARQRRCVAEALARDPAWTGCL